MRWVSEGESAWVRGTSASAVIVLVIVFSTVLGVWRSGGEGRSGEGGIGSTLTVWLCGELVSLLRGTVRTSDLARVTGALEAWLVASVVCTLGHVVGVWGIGGLQYNIWVWLQLGVGLLLAGITAYGVRWIQGTASLATGTRSAIVHVGWCLGDIRAVTWAGSAVWTLAGYMYQTGYFALRLFLVFCLHTFCMGSLSELATGSGGALLVVSGILGPIVVAGLMGGGYMAIQAYVYVSFSLRFLAGSALGYGDSTREVVSSTSTTWLVTVSVATAGGEAEGPALATALALSMYSPRPSNAVTVGEQAGTRAVGQAGH